MANVFFRGLAMTREAKQPGYFSIQRASWLLGAIALSSQGCSPQVMGSPCDRIEQAVYTAPETISASLMPVDRATAMYASKRQSMLAEQLTRIPIADEVLSAGRDNLVSLYSHDSDLGLQVSAFMSDGGEILVDGGDRTAYEQVAYQRIVLNEQVNEQLGAIYRYCSGE